MATADTAAVRIAVIAEALTTRAHLAGLAVGEDDDALVGVQAAGAGCPA